MGRLSTRLTAALAATALSAAGSAFPDLKSGKSKAVVLNVSAISVDGPACVASLRGVTYRLPDQDAQLLAVLNEDHKMTDRVHIIAGIDTPWRCVGGVMAITARARFKKVGFISQPPSPDDK